MNAIISLEINLSQLSPESRHRLQFNKLQLRSFMGSIGAFHNEVLIWNVGNHFAVWATGVDPGVLKHAFVDLSGSANAFTIRLNEEAIIFFKNIVKNIQWDDVKRFEVFRTLRDNTLIAAESETLGNVLQPLCGWAFRYLENLPVISAFENFWTFKNELHKEAAYQSIHRIEGLPAILLRASVN